MTSSSAKLILKAALGASLALNLVFGALLFWPDAGRPHGVRGLQARMERVLGPEDRATFHRVMEESRPRWEPLRRDMWQARPQVGRAIGAEPFSEEALRAAMAEGRHRWAAFSEAYEDSLARATAAISPEGRRRLLADMPENRE
ncbi:periplasmic heavy metal sensor [Pseudoroseomonas wenyumeiae]|uniref:Periplasmic heavy metal sensor n=1 Tax=Teichococcus wenyumeiae TaxID=2478470 RepID=A0A3A9J5D1_9PROT|nr:periplasmic heavy metal sensor [Pseudoroseomonas wenyumeiae]RKK01100.1 periplasmic heavy metal sensor [Pseudoroseomonas wenyumeiae]RMI25038.1 periplasmic heavy metal sensor [Pseudoroseomonas wenyumeiae]